MQWPCQQKRVHQSLARHGIGFRDLLACLSSMSLVFQDPALAMDFCNSEWVLLNRLARGQASQNEWVNFLNFSRRAFRCRQTHTHARQESIFGHVYIYIYMPTSQTKGRNLKILKLNKGTRRWLCGPQPFSNFSIFALVFCGYAQELARNNELNKGTRRVNFSSKNAQKRKHTCAPFTSFGASRCLTRRFCVRNARNRNCRSPLKALFL